MLDSLEQTTTETIHLTDEAIAALLLEHLQPRFRAILEGIVK